MMAAEHPYLAILLMACASYFCRIIGYFLMGYVRVTPRVEAWLGALPLSVMGAFLVPAAVNSGPAEMVGFVVTFIAYRIVRHEIVGALAGVAAVAAIRAIFL